MSDKKVKIIALFGKSGAGKDYLRNQLITAMPSNTQKIISYTTRPKRDYEISGIDYYFVSPDEFLSLQQAGVFLETTTFLTYKYGTSITSLNTDKINIGVFNIEGIDTLLNKSQNEFKDKIKVYPILVEAPDNTRLIRSLNREKEPDCKEICRRFLADERDFSWIPFEYKTHISGDPFTFLDEVDLD